MRSYWLTDQHGDEGPTALVETDGSLHVVDITRFGPGITSLEQQQELWDRFIGRVAPTLKPLVDAGSLDVEGEPPNPKLNHGENSARRSKGRGGSVRSSGRAPSSNAKFGEGRGHSGHR